MIQDRKLEVAMCWAMFIGLTFIVIVIAMIPALFFNYWLVFWGSFAVLEAINGWVLWYILKK